MSEKDKGPSPLAKEQPSEPTENQNPITKVKGIDAVGILWTFGKCLTALLPVYLAGYYRVSSSLVVFGLALYSGWKHNRQAKEARLRSAVQLLNEDSESSSSLYRSQKDLPVWVRTLNKAEKIKANQKVLRDTSAYVSDVATQPTTFWG